MSEQLEVQLLALPLLLVSFRWWENYANTNEAIGEFNESRGDPHLFM